MIRLRRSALILLGCVILALGADEGGPDTSRLGGPATIDSREPNAFSLPAPGLDAAARRGFAVGNSFFRRNWVTSPASAEARDGLGPLFNARSCSACHAEDGRGRPPLESGEVATGMIIRISPHDADGSPHPIYGDQIQDQAVLGETPEASIVLSPVFTQGEYTDGDRFELLHWDVQLTSRSGETINDVRLSPRVGQQLIGMGMLEAIDSNSIAVVADPDDRDRDGISGRANMVIHPRTGERVLGRFGWKAGRPDLESQIAGALREDIGITSPVFPASSDDEPEIDQAKLDRLVHYCRTLAVPAQRDPDSSEVRRGRELFAAVGCTACHAPSADTGTSSLIEVFRNETIRPYTDLLLHDMGDGLADDRQDGEASGREWRTPPLWGIGLIETVNGHTRFLHDGRARSLEEAVLWHGGEAESARRSFMTLSREDRAAVIRFLESL